MGREVKYVCYSTMTWTVTEKEKRNKNIPGHCERTHIGGLLVQRNRIISIPTPPNKLKKNGWRCRLMDDFFQRHLFVLYLFLPLAVQSWPGFSLFSVSFYWPGHKIVLRQESEDKIKSLIHNL